MNQRNSLVQGLGRVFGFVRFESKDVVSYMLHLTKYPWHSLEQSNFQYPLPRFALEIPARWSSIYKHGNGERW